MQKLLTGSLLLLLLTTWSACGPDDTGGDGGGGGDDMPPEMSAPDADMGSSDGEDMAPDLDPPADMGAKDMDAADMDAPIVDMGVDMAAPKACELDLPAMMNPLDAPTTFGLYRGVEEGASVKYLGIPYAAPPVGELRWRPPEAPACVNEVQVASDFGEKCMQVAENGDIIGSEDCLTLNVWRPSQKPTADDLRPVMLFIHGGGNVQGSSSDDISENNPLYDGHYLVDRHDVVVVSINYRLGPFGFLALDAFAAESEQGSAGNYGLLDQIAALEWVRENITTFGGDPENVMIFGESAGAVNTCMMLATPLASGLFHRALMQSGGCLTDTAEDARALGADLVGLTPCAEEAPGEDRARCMRALDARTIHETIPGVIPLAVGQGSGEVRGEYGPNIDGWVLPEEPIARFRKGAHNKVPVVIGSNAEEMESFLSPAQITQQQYEQAVRGLLISFGAGVPDEALALYPSEDHASPRKALEQLLTDATFTCPAGRILGALEQGQQEPVYRYFFSKQAITRMGNLPARHGIELLYVFYTLTQIPFFSPDPSDVTLAEAMMAYWSSFASEGTPTGSVRWSQWSSNEDPYLILDAPIAQASNLRKEKCDFWDRFDPR